MFKIKITIHLLLIAAFMGRAFLPAPVAASGNLVVTFENTPLFNQAKFLPGESVARWVKVENTGTASLNIGVKAVSVIDENGLGSRMNVVIKEGNDEVYKGKLYDFLAGSEIPLSTLTGGQTTQYDFTIDFTADTGNAFQGKGLSFNLVFGSISSVTGGISSFSSSGSTGGSGTGKKENKTPIVAGEAGAVGLVVEKSVLTEKANPGQKGVEYKIVITNNGNMAAYDVAMTDALPAGLFFSGTKDDTKTWNIGDIESGAFQSFNYLVDISDEAKPGIYTNTVTANAADSEPVMATADLEIVKVSVLGAAMAQTGFSLGELILLLSLLAVLIAVSFILRKKA